MLRRLPKGLGQGPARGSIFEDGTSPSLRKVLGVLPCALCRLVDAHPTGRLLKNPLYTNPPWTATGRPRIPAPFQLLHQRSAEQRQTIRG